MMRWLPYAVVAALFLALADFFVKQASSRISPSLGMVVYGLITFLGAVSWLLYQRLTGQAMMVTRLGVVYAAGVGIAFTGVTLLLYLTFARISVSVGSPVIRLTGIVLTSLLGILILREPITARYVLGLVLAIAGVALIVFR